MAAQPNKPAPANQVLADLNSRYGTKAAVAPVAPKKDTTDYSKVGLSMKKSSDATKQDPVSFVIDMLSRPLYAVTDTLQGQFQAAAGMDKVKRAGGSLGDQYAAAADAVVHHNPLTGLFSTDKANKMPTAPLIEYGTDTVGKLTDPNYVNRKDNVNPILKGVAGFVGDVVLDPTTWIPGAQIAKGANIALKAVKGLSTGVADIAKAAKAVKNGEKITEELAKTAPITPENAALSDAAKAVQDGPAAPPLPVELTPAQKLTQTTQGLEKQAILAIGAPKNADIKTALASIKTPVLAEQAIKATSAPAPAAALGFQDWIKGASESIQEVFQRPKLIDLPRSKAMGAFEKVSIGGEKIPLPLAVARAQAQDPVALTDLAHYYNTIYKGRHAKGAAEGKLIDPLGQVIKPISTPVVDAARLTELQTQMTSDAIDAQEFAAALGNPAGRRVAEDGVQVNNAEWIQQEIAAANKENGVTNETHQSVLDWMKGQAEESKKAFDAAELVADPAAATVLNSMQAFKSGQLANQAFVEGALGKDLVKNLRLHANPGQFDTVIKNLTAIMDGSLNITAMTKIQGSTKLLLQKLGFDSPMSIPANLKVLRAEANVMPLPKVNNRIDSQAIIDAAKVDDTPAETVTLATKVLTETTMQNVVALRDPIKYPYVTQIEYASRTDAEFGKGLGNIGDEWNTRTQADAFYSAVKNARDAVIAQLPNGKAPLGGSRAMRYSDVTREALRIVERGLDEMGIPVTIGTGTAERTAMALTDKLPGTDRLLLGQSQILDVLDEINPELARIISFNGNTAVPHTNLLDAIHIAVHGGTDADIARALSNVMPPYGTKPYENKLINPVTYTGKGGSKYMYGTKIFKEGELLTPTVALVRKATPSLQAIIAKNAAAHQARGLSETMKMTTEQLTFLENTYASAEGFGPLLQTVADTGGRLLRTGKDFGALDESTLKAGAIISASIPVEHMATATVAVKIQEAADSIGVKLTPEQQLGEFQKIINLHTQGLYETTIAEASKRAVMEATGASLDIGTVTQRNIAVGMFAAFAPLNRMFGNKLLHNDFRFSEDMARDLNMHAADGLAKIDKKYTREVKAQAFLNLQRGIKSSNALHAAAAEEYRPFVQQLFGGAAEFSLKDSGFFRNGNSLYHINSVFEQKGLGEHIFDVARAKADAAKSGKSLMHEAAAQWMAHDVKDPSEYLNQMFGAFVQVNAHHTLAMEAMSIAHLNGGISKIPREGYVKLVNDSGKSILAAYFPPDVYFPKEVAQQIGVVDSLIQETLDLGGPIGSFVNNVYRPALDMFKVGMTILQPAHHVRNALSDMDLTRNAEGFTTKPIYKWAMEAIATRNTYDRFDAIAALNGIHTAPKPGRALFKGSLAKDGISPADLYNNIASRGVLPNYKRLENLEEVGTKSALSRAETAISNTRVVKAAAGISEANSHFTRLAHAAQFIEKNINNTKDYKTMSDLWDAAAIQVKKWHPDGSDLSKFDKVMRLIIPFYSWQRKSIPLVLETFLMNPARAEVIPKASYALATSMGVNPDSLSDPFPTDQMFPSYLTDKTMGPQFRIAGKYFGLNPGFATTGTLDTYLGNNPLSAVLGQVSPFIRSPFELAAGANVGTGAKINDTSDYIDSSIPIVAPLSRLTGTSVTGSIASILQGKGLDPQYQIRAGNKDAATSQVTALTNYLSGLALTPMSQPNQRNYAELEKRNAAAALTKGN